MLTDVADDSPLMREEIFGPVVCLVPFIDEDEVIRRANDTPYGLSASLWSKDVDQVHRVAAQLRVSADAVGLFSDRDIYVTDSSLSILYNRCTIIRSLDRLLFQRKIKFHSVKDLPFNLEAVGELLFFVRRWLYSRVRQLSIVWLLKLLLWRCWTDIAETLGQ